MLMIHLSLLYNTKFSFTLNPFGIDMYGMSSVI